MALKKEKFKKIKEFKDFEQEMNRDNILKHLNRWDDFRQRRLVAIDEYIKARGRQEAMT